MLSDFEVAMKSLAWIPYSGSCCEVFTQVICWNTITYFTVQHWSANDKKLHVIVCISNLLWDIVQIVYWTPTLSWF